VVGWSLDDPGDGYVHIQAPDREFVGGMMPIRPEMRGARPAWLAYISVDEVDRSVADIEAAGGTVTMPAMDMENVGRFALVTDPQGAAFYVMKSQPPAGRPAGESTAFGKAPGHCGWNELATTDPEAAANFYVAQFGWELPEPMDMGAMGKYQFVAKGERTWGAIMRRQNEGQPVAWLPYFHVPSIAAAKAAIQANGGKVWMGPHEVPGGDWIVVASDPQDAPFGLIGAKGE
jgi:predicted enzyme related to lactoylglutathione lyase